MSVVANRFRLLSPLQFGVPSLSLWFGHGGAVLVVVTQCPPYFVVSPVRRASSATAGWGAVGYRRNVVMSASVLVHCISFDCVSFTNIWCIVVVEKLRPCDSVVYCSDVMVECLVPAFTVSAFPCSTPLLVYPLYCGL